MKFRSLAFVSVPFAVLFGLGCEAGGGATSTAAGGSASVSTSDGSTVASSSVVVGSTAVGSTSNGFSTGSDSSSGIGGNSCTSTSVQTEPVPLDMIILLDESGSMSGSKWDTATAAIKSFVTDPASDGIGVGIKFFPVNGSPDCNFADYAMLDVDIGVLPGNTMYLVNAINAETVQGGTPTFGALKGVLSRATQYQDLYADHKVIVVLASDGDPNGCETSDIDDIAALAQSAYNYNGVQTYVIAMAGATVANLDKIAQKGGTVEAYDVTGSITQFSTKMAEIRATALPCEFIIPPPPAGEMLDPKLVNVNYTPGSGVVQGLPKADNQMDCGAGPGWYYDNEMNPTKILLCPASCNLVKSDTNAKVDVAFGCSTIPN